MYSSDSLLRLKSTSKSYEICDQLWRNERRWNAHDYDKAVCECKFKDEWKGTKRGGQAIKIEMVILRV